MLLTLTDHLTCPSCGPSAGLVLLIEAATDRRVVSGALGCPVCRVQYGIADGVADLRGGEVGAVGAAAPAPSRDVPGMDPVRIAALLDLAGGGGFVLLDGPAAAQAAPAVAALAPDHEIVVSLPDGAPPVPAHRQAVSVLRDAGALPMQSGAMRAVAALGGAPGEERLKELVRVCRPTGRLVIDLGEQDAARLDEVAARLETAGVSPRARDESGLVAVVG